MKDKREITDIMEKIDNARTYRLHEMVFESYALNNGSGGNLKRYLKLKKEYDLLTVAFNEVEKVLTKNYDY